MPDKLVGMLKEKAPFLFKDTMPVWLTLIAAALTGGAAGVGTYYLAPAINRQYQIDEARNNHLASTTKALNDQIVMLSEKVRRLNDYLVNDPKKAPDVRQDCLDLTTMLQWMLVDLRVVLKTKHDLAEIDHLADAIDGVKRALDASIDERAQPQLLAAMRNLAERTRDVLDRLYVAASLK